MQVDRTCTARVEAVPDLYFDAVAAGDPTPILAACPDHYIARTRPDGRQEVVETTGGAPLPLRMVFDRTDLRTLVTPPDPAFPVQWAGVARTEHGAALGGTRHQFRDERAGFLARLTVELPATLPPEMLREHRWHLACEFSNWVEAVNGG